MRADPNRLPLFDDDLDDVTRLRQAAWDHASRIAFIGRRGVHRAAIEGLSNALLRMCVPRDLNGEHWPSERQMHWLEEEAYRRCKEPPTAVEMEAWLLERFDPPPSWGNSFAAWDRARERWKTRPHARAASIVESSPLMRMGSVISAHAPLATKRDAKNHRLSRKIRLSR